MPTLTRELFYNFFDPQPLPESNGKAWSWYGGGFSQAAASPPPPDEVYKRNHIYITLDRVIAAANSNPNNIYEKICTDLGVPVEETYLIVGAKDSTLIPDRTREELFPNVLFSTITGFAIFYKDKENLLTGATAADLVGTVDAVINGAVVPQYELYGNDDSPSDFTPTIESGGLLAALEGAGNTLIPMNYTLQQDNDFIKITNFFDNTNFFVDVSGLAVRGGNDLLSARHIIDYFITPWIESNGVFKSPNRQRLTPAITVVGEYGVQGDYSEPNIVGYFLVQVNSEIYNLYAGIVPSIVEDGFADLTIGEGATLRILTYPELSGPNQRYYIDSNLFFLNPTYPTGSVIGDPLPIQGRNHLALSGNPSSTSLVRKVFNLGLDATELTIFGDRVIYGMSDDYCTEFPKLDTLTQRGFLFQDGLAFQSTYSIIDLSTGTQTPDSRPTPAPFSLRILVVEVGEGIGPADPVDDGSQDLLDDNIYQRRYKAKQAILLRSDDLTAVVNGFIADARLSLSAALDNVEPVQRGKPLDMDKNRITDAMPASTLASAITKAQMESL